MFSVFGFVIWLGYELLDVWLVCLFLYYVGGFFIFMCCVWYGIIVYLESDFDVGWVVEILDVGWVILVFLVFIMLEWVLDV